VDIGAEHEVEASANIPRRGFGDGFFDKHIQLIQIKFPYDHSCTPPVATITRFNRVVIDTGSLPTTNIYPKVLAGPTGNIFARQHLNQAGRHAVCTCSIS
jgi:hypothetical protein